MNYYIDITAEETLKCSPEEALELMKLLTPDEPTALGGGEALTATHNDSCLTAEYYPKEGEIHFFAEDYGNIDAIPDEFIERLGKLLAKLKLPHLQFGVACTGDKHDPGSHYGAYFRITADGRLVNPKLVWPKTAPPQKQTAKKTKKSESRSKAFKQTPGGGTAARKPKQEG